MNCPVRFLVSFRSPLHGAIRRGALAALAVFAGGSLRVSAAEAPGSFTVENGADAVAVIYHDGASSWKAVVSRRHGGVISGLHLPADAPNLVPGGTGALQGLFDLRYAARGPAAAADQAGAKGAIWADATPGDVRVVRQNADEVIVETSGHAGGWAPLGPKGEPLVAYRQTYTFRPSGIVCDGAVTWIDGRGTRLANFALESSLVSQAISYPVQVVGANGVERDLALTGGAGDHLPAGTAFPVTMKITLKDGYQLRYHTLEMPAPVTASPWYALEFPWRRNWAQSLAIEGDADRAGIPMSAGRPAHYHYALDWSRLPPAERPPLLAVVSPECESTRQLGEAVPFSATATDGGGAPIPFDKFKWNVYFGEIRPGSLAATRRGADFTYVLPGSPAGLRWHDDVLASVSVTDAAGRRSTEYVKANVNVAAPPIAPPPFHWGRATPESEGFSTAKLDELRADLVARGTAAFLLIRDDKIVSEWYAPTFFAAERHYTASLAKAIVGGVSLVAAMNYEPIGIDEPAWKYIPQWRDDPVKSRITLLELGAHTSGLIDAEGPSVPQAQYPGWSGEFWRREPPPDDPFTLARDVTPVRWAPGTHGHYSNPGIAMLTYAVTVALKSAPEHDIRSLLRERIMRPIGVPDGAWDCGYDQTFLVDGLPLVASWGGADYTARATARVGRLLLREGNWDGVQLLTPESVRATTRDLGLPGAANSGFANADGHDDGTEHGIGNGGVNSGWFTNADGRVPGLPRDAYFGGAGEGSGDQILLIVPSLNLIMVRYGSRLVQTGNHDLETYLLEPLMKTLGR